jgi:hypothetical protein
VAYLLFFELKTASELACDEKVTQNYSSNQKLAYGRLLLNTTTTLPVPQYGHSFLGNHKQTIKERIMMIKKPVTTRLSLALLAGCILLSGSTLSVAAYEEPYVLETDDNVSEDIDWYMFTTDAPEDDTDPYESYFSDSDSFFVDEYGQVSFDVSLSSDRLRSSCAHSYVSGTYYSHKKNSSGGCTYSTYSAKKCSKCGALKDRKLIKSVTYPTCPHK